ncbi:ribosomal protein L7/L12 [Nannocystis punicea]|uniref:Ribosomal protein L7/L12 n=1 Tax=Nannocystis punicea TaxID=2995304 RepID=A0ABY7H2Q0_9BACT|nr:ribosomal protein L7/L12 [Nannocystis poenicansa]WAS93539.1 ribosomal protein L7/L12 [Nannocystis poenicansa]
MTVGGQSGEVIPQDLILRDAGANPAAVAEAVRAMTGLEAPAAAELVARTPSAIRTRIAPALAEALRVKLVAAGATVELRPHGAAPAPEFFDVYLQDKGDSKIGVVRALKMMTGLGLREAVELVDDAPCLVRRRVPQDEAEALRHELVEAGAIVEVRAHESSAPPERTASGEAAVTWGATTSEPTAKRASEPITGFAVVLHHFGTRKLDVVKAIRDFTGLGLKDAKDLAESTEVVLKQGMSEPEARSFAQALSGVDASVSVRGAAATTPSPVGGSGGDGSEVVLHHFGTRKIDVIKLIREATALGLKEAKDLSESTDVVIKSGMREDEAQKLARALAVVGARVSVRGAPAPEPERSNLPEPSVGYGVVLRSHGSNKISVIKIIREATNLGLKEAKDLAESTDVMIKDGLSGSEAQALAQSLTAIGARVEVRSPAWTDDSEADADDGPYSTAPLDVILGACGPQKIAVIKVIREELGCGLKEAKDLSETPGAVLREGLRRAEAEELARKLTALGAAVELREMWRRAEPAEVDVFLQSHGPNKISVIKEVRALTGLGLKDAKDLVEAAPTLIKQKVELATARQLQAVLAEVGAEVELR